MKEIGIANGHPNCMHSVYVDFFNDNGEMVGKTLNVKQAMLGDPIVVDNENVAYITIHLALYKSNGVYFGEVEEADKFYLAPHKLTRINLDGNVDLAPSSNNYGANIIIVPNI